MVLIVDESDKGTRLDKYLALHTEYSRSKIEKMLKEGLIEVDGKEEKASFKVALGSKIIIPDDYETENHLLGEDIHLNIVYEDDDIIVVDKPSGMVVHPGAGNKEHTLANALIHHTKTLSSLNGEFRPGIVHRIDKDTSGIILVAKNDRVHAVLAENFKNKTIKRVYIALVEGEIPSSSGTIDAPIGRDFKDRKRMCIRKDNSKTAVTHFRVIERFKGYTLIELRLETGRTHQIRIHMKYIGYPVYNDPVYSHENISGFGQFLHAKSLEFEHPTTHKNMYFESDLPEKFKEFLSKLEKY